MDQRISGPFNQLHATGKLRELEISSEQFKGVLITLLKFSYCMDAPLTLWRPRCHIGPQHIFGCINLDVIEIAAQCLQHLYCRTRQEHKCDVYEYVEDLDLRYFMKFYFTTSAWLKVYVLHYLPKVIINWIYYNKNIESIVNIYGQI